MLINPQINSVSIVLIGSFNPRIFRPEWFAQQGIIGETEGASADIEIIHRNLTSFNLDWGQVSVQPQKFSLTQTAPPLIRAKDFVIKTFSDYLTHTPIYQMGINRSVHFEVDSFGDRDRIGKKLAPQSAWGEWGKQIEGDPTNMAFHGGMLSLTMQQKTRDDGLAGQINARVEPSQVFIEKGIFIEVNDHIVLGNEDDPEAAEDAMDTLREHWGTSISKSEWIIDQIMALAGKK